MTIVNLKPSGFHYNFFKLTRFQYLYKFKACEGIQIEAK